MCVGAVRGSCWMGQRCYLFSAGTTASGYSSSIPVGRVWPLGMDVQELNVCCRLRCQLANGGQAIVDRRGTETWGRQAGSPVVDRRFGQAGTEFRAVPGQELVESHTVNTTGDRRRDRVEHKLFDAVPVGRL